MDAYVEAQRLYAEAVLSTAPARERAAQLHRTVQRIGELAMQAPPRDTSAVLMLNSSLAGLLAEETR